MRTTAALTAAVLWLAGMAGVATAQTLTPDAGEGLVTPDTVALDVHSGGRLLEGAFAKGQGKDEVDGLAFIHQWPGVYFESAFHGTDVILRFNDDANHYDLIVDGQAPLAVTRPGASEIRLSGLADSDHTIRLEKTSESQAATGEFDGFFIPPGEGALPVPEHARSMEFIGDSYTVGYGNTSTTRTCSQDEIWATTDTSQAFAPQVAKHYDADYQINAYSGRGIVRNYDGVVPGEPLPALYGSTLLDTGGPQYDVTDWTPQVVVIALGGNDFSTPVHATGEKWHSLEALRADYIASYLAFVRQVRQQQPDAMIVLMSYHDAEVVADIAEVAAKLKAGGDDRIDTLDIAAPLAKTGCDWHLSTADDKVVADALIAAIDSHADAWGE